MNKFDLINQLFFYSNFILYYNRMSETLPEKNLKKSETLPKKNSKKKKRLTIKKKTSKDKLEKLLKKNNQPILFENSSFSDRYSGISSEGKSDNDNYWILSDKTKYPKFIYNENDHDNFTEDISKNEREPLKIWNEDTNNYKNISPFKHQKFVSDYLSDKSPYRGLLLYHGLGSGKSGASIMIAEGYRQRQIVVLLPASLRQNYEKEIQTFGDISYRKNYYWCFITINLDGSETDKESIYEIFEKKGISRHNLHNILTDRGDSNSKGIWMIDYTKDVTNYSILPNDEKSEIDIQIDKMYKKKYIFIHYNAGKWTLPSVFNKLSPKNYDKVKTDLLGEVISDTDLSKIQMNKIVQEFISNNQIDNPFDNKVIIIDEVHNLGSLMAGGGSTGPNLYQLLVTAKNCKIVMLSGTPVINKGYELALIFNILKGTMRSWKMDLLNKKWNHEELVTLLNNNPLINRVIVDSSRKNIEITRNPHGFGTLYDDSGKKKGTIKNDDYNITDDLFLEKLILNLGRKNYVLASKSPISTHEYKLFPDPFRKQHHGKFKYNSKLKDESENAFNDYYIDYNTFGVKNKMSFKTRILGLVSFYNEISGTDPKTGYKLFPDKIYASDEETEVIMSDYQFLIYSIGRDIERELELKSKKSASYNQSSEIMNQSKNKTPNLFRVLSRQSGIAIFPPGIKRPRPKDFKYDRAEQEIRNFYLTSKNDIKDLLLEICSKGENEPLIGDFIEKLNLDDQDSLNIYNKINTFKKMFQIEKDNLEEGDVKRVITELENENCQQLEEKDPEELNYIESCLHAIDQINPDHFKINSLIPNNLTIISPKYKKIVENISKTGGPVFCYSQFRSVEGIEIFSRVLIANGYKKLNDIIKEQLQFDGKSSDDELTIGRIVRVMTNKTKRDWKNAKIIEITKDNRYLLDFFDDKEPCNRPSDCLDPDNICINSECSSPGMILSKKLYYNRSDIYPAYFALWTGTESVEERSKVQEIFNNYNNRYGQLCLILLATASGAEGISLMNVRQVHIMEPYWNNVRIDQVIGRARRIKSHVNLLPYQQNVKIYQYIIKFSENQLNGNWGEELDYTDFIDYESKKSDKIQNLSDRLKETLDEFITIVNNDNDVILIPPLIASINNQDLVNKSSEILNDFQDQQKYRSYTNKLTPDNFKKINSLITNVKKLTDKIISAYSNAEEIGEKYIPNWDSLKPSEKTSRKGSIIQRLTNQVNNLDNNKTSDEVLEDISNKKTKILYDFLHQLKEASVDCKFNRNDNIRSDSENEKITCVNTIPVKGDFTFELTNDLLDNDTKMLELSITKENIHEFKPTYTSSKFGDFKVVIFTTTAYEDYRDYLMEGHTLDIYNFYSYYNLDYTLADISGRKDKIGTISFSEEEGFKPTFNKEFRKRLKFYTQIQKIIDKDNTIPDKKELLIEWSNLIKSTHSDKNTKSISKKSKQPKMIKQQLKVNDKTWKCLLCSPNKDLTDSDKMCPIHPFFSREMYNKMST